MQDLAATLPYDKDGSSPRSYVITLVHGTWVHNPRWIHVGSPFCTNLEHELKERGAQQVKFFPFEWSGGNTHQDRRLASVDLRKQLLRRLDKYPLANHYIVAHSHGGNVALRAVHRSCTLRKALSGLVTLGTPFLILSRAKYFPGMMSAQLTRALDKEASRIKEKKGSSHDELDRYHRINNSIFSWLLMATLILLGIAIFVPQSISSWLPRFMQRTALKDLPGMCAALAGMSFMLFFLLVALLPTRDAIHNLAAKSAPIIYRYNYFQYSNIPIAVAILNMSSRLDEAHGALTGVWWMHRVATWIVRFAIIAALSISVAIAGLWAYCIRLTYLYISSLLWHPLILMLGKFIFWIEIALYAPVLAVGTGLAKIFTFLLLNLVERTSPFLNLTKPEDNLFCDVKATRELPSAINAKSLRYSSWKLLLSPKSEGRLLHSRIHSYLPAIRDIADWMAFREN